MEELEELEDEEGEMEDGKEWRGSLTDDEGLITSRNKFDSNNDASNKCENERIFLNLLDFT